MLSGMHQAILFDIDGTLLVQSSAHLAVLSEVLSSRVSREVRIRMDGERPTLDGVDIAGWTDAQIIRHVLGSESAVAPESEVATLVSAYAQAYRAMPVDLRLPRLVEGAEEVLEILQAAGVWLGLLTGNASEIARAKLASVGLDRFFNFDPDLGFGDWRADRAALATAALQAARRAADVVSMVGDTELDMSAAHGAGLRAIGVTTGACTPTQLTAAGADIVLASIRELPTVLEQAMK
jgi:phosphoglycolate phosphatase-like HAD superfamily hydrolase